MKRALKFGIALLGTLLLCSQTLALPKTITFVPKPPTLNSDAFVLMDFHSGRSLIQMNADERMSPASLTKLMTLYVVFHYLETGEIKLDDMVRISKKAWKTEGSRMFLQVDSKVSVEELIRGMIVASGNDASVALAEHIAGSEESFTHLMNQQAKQLGMNNSNFTDATGMPHDNHYSTPGDIAILSRALIRNFPQYYPYFSEKWFHYNGIKQPNRNRLLWRYDQADGLKTGHTSEAGYCLSASAVEDDTRLVSVVMHADNDSKRTSDTIKLFRYGFRFFETHKLYSANQAITKSRVWMGSEKDVEMGVTEDVYVNIPKGQYRFLNATVELRHPIKAPVTKGEQYGILKITLKDEVIDERPIVALKDDPKGGFFSRMMDAAHLSIKKLLSKDM